jgi:hypothetical protein
MESKMNVLKINIWGDIPENYTGIVEHPNGIKIWYLNGKYHREDGPAIENNNGQKVWYSNDKLHRVDGPAIDYLDGHKEWWLNDKKHSQEEWFEKLSEEDKLNAIWNLR